MFVNYLIISAITASYKKRVTDLQYKTFIQFNFNLHVWLSYSMFDRKIRVYPIWLWSHSCFCLYPRIESFAFMDFWVCNKSSQSPDLGQRSLPFDKGPHRLNHIASILTLFSCEDLYICLALSLTSWGNSNRCLT